MSYNDKKFLDVNGLKHLISILDDYPTNEVLGTVINAIESEIPTNVSQLQNDAGYLTQHQDISGKANSADLAAVATSGDYDDLINKPTIPEVPVSDVQVNGTSVVSQGVANVPLAQPNSYGVSKADATLGVYANGGFLSVARAEDNTIKAGAGKYKPLVPYTQHLATFYGLAKAAGADMKDIANTTVGTYPDAQKAAIQNMLGVTNLISTEETTTATAAHALNSLFLMGGKLYKATAAIAIGDAVVEGTNCEVVKADEVFVKKTDYATDSIAGVVKVMPALGLMINNGFLTLNPATSEYIKSGNEPLRMIPTRVQHESVFYGLSKVAGVDLANETVTLGTYPETSKTAIRSLIGAAAASDIPSVPVQDVQVNGTSVLSNGVANVPVASDSTLGVVKVGGYGMGINGSGSLFINGANEIQIKAGTYGYGAITAIHQHESVFYGLTKAAGVDMSSSSNPVGTYTNEAKVAIRNMLGAASPDVIAIQDTQPTDTDTKVWLPGTQAAGVQVPTMEDLESGYVKKTDIATSTDAGIVKVSSNLGVCFYQSTNYLGIQPATTQYIKDGTTSLYPIAPNTVHSVAFYGLAKAAGDTTQAASDNAVGTYTDGAKTAIQSMLGITQTITVIAQTQDNVTVTDQTVYLREDDANGPIYASAAYEGQPVSFAVPSGFHYHISISDTLAHHFNPTTVSGIVTNASIAATITYSDFSSIASAGDIKAALNAGMDLTDLVGEQITCTRNNETLTWDVVDYDSTNKSIMLLLHDAFGSANMVFEPAQALMWCENGLAAGNYKFTVGTTVYYFTLTQAIPAGGQLVASDSGTFSTYASQSATATIETGTVSTTEITGATDLGTAGSGLLNHNSRVRYGSNNYAESALLWWLNSDDAANTQRVPVTKFSRAYSYNVPGFLYNLDSSFIACLDDVEWKCSTNNVYECPQSLGGYTAGTGRAYTITKKIGLASEMEIFGSYGGNADGSSIFDLYNDASVDDRKKYRSTSAQTWWLRSPSWSYAHYEGFVYSSGGASIGYAYSSYAVVPACRISADEEAES